MKKFIFTILLFISGIAHPQITFVPLDATTIYDLQSNSTPVHIIRDKNNVNNLHAVYMSSPYDDITFTQRRARYSFSSDGGQTWGFSWYVAPFGREGFPVISVTSNGNALISSNYTSGVTTKTTTFVDAFPGLGSFTNLGNSTCNGLYPALVASKNISQTEKFYLVNSEGFVSGLSLNTPSYTPCTLTNNVSVISNSVAIGADGRIGLAFIADVSRFPGDIGDVYFIESTNNGQTFSTPLKIFDAIVNPDNTLLGAFRGISLVYRNNTPCVVFEIAKHSTGGQFFPAEPGGIMFWSSNLSGSDPNRSKYIARNDSTSFTSYIPFYKAYGNDVLTSICRPSIGSYNDTTTLSVVFMSATPNVKVSGSDTICYNSIYMVSTGNSGVSWKRPKKITPDELMDWSYPSISEYNYSNGNFLYETSITATKDTIPGSYVNNSQFGKSLAQQYFINVRDQVFIEPPTITSTSGNIKYNDNNQLVTNGIVKALRFDAASGQVIITATAPIDANGNYGLGFDIPYYNHYIVAYPNSEPTSDFVPTYYPQTIDWQSATVINTSQNNSNVDIKVFRKNNLSGSDLLMGTVNRNQNNQYSILPDANLYLKSGGTFVAATQSNSAGRYSFPNMPNGNYDIISGKLGYSTITRNIQLNTPVMDSVNFALNQILIGIHNISNEVPDRFSLYQNYPNPFNPVTNIRFDIQKNSFVKLKVFDLLGKEIISLVNENKTAGSYVVDFNATELTSGVYFYRLETESYTETRRMVILK